jgi:hypothetical protein
MNKYYWILNSSTDKDNSVITFGCDNVWKGIGKYSLSIFQGTTIQDMVDKQAQWESTLLSMNIAQDAIDAYLSDNAELIAQYDAIDAEWLNEQEEQNNNINKDGSK